ncbi:MAG TPA: class I SAM-dependent methyltransferase [bacterium]|nr:class I SAM-dependent methyltransferase [bacterium]
MAGGPVTQVRNMLTGFNAVFALDVGIDTGLVDNLAAQEPVSLERFVNSTEMHPRHVGAWLRAVQAAGVVEVDKDGMARFSPGWRDALTNPDSPDYVRTLPGCYAAVAGVAYPRFAGLFKSQETMDWRDFPKDVIKKVYADGARFGREFADEVVPVIPGLKARLESGIMVYDVGCGDGGFLFRFAEKYPRSNCLGIDCCQAAIDLANEGKSKIGRQTKIQFTTQMIHELPEAQADLIVLSEVLHEVGADKRGDLLQAIYRTLKPGGVLFVVDPVLPDSHEGYLTRSAQHLAMMVFSEAPLVPDAPLTRKDFFALLKAAGFDQSLNEVGSSDSYLTAWVVK